MMLNMDWSKLSSYDVVKSPNVSNFRTVKSMERAVPHLNNNQEFLKNAIFLQQQFKYKQSRKLRRESGSP